MTWKDLMEFRELMWKYFGVSYYPSEDEWRKTVEVLIKNDYIRKMEAEIAGNRVSVYIPTETGRDFVKNVANMAKDRPMLMMHINYLLETISIQLEMRCIKSRECKEKLEKIEEETRYRWPIFIKSCRACDKFYFGDLEKYLYLDSLS